MVSLARSDEALAVLYGQLVRPGDQRRVGALVTTGPQRDGGHKLTGVGNFHAFVGRGVEPQLPNVHLTVDSESTCTATLSSVMSATSMQVCEP